MSLINDALKKAQNRHGDSTPATPGAAGPAAIPSAPRKGKSPVGKIALICVGIALLSGAVSTTVILLVVRDENPAPLPAPTTPQAAPTTPAGTPATATPVIPASPIATTPVLTPSATPSPVAPATSETPIQPAPATPVVSLPPPAPEPVAPAIKIGTRIQAFVDRLRITSIRISDTGNKVILNDRLFRVNDLVEPSLGLRLTDIQQKQLTFTDESGNTYLRHF
jgi:hypothetical protein